MKSKGTSNLTTLLFYPETLMMMHRQFSLHFRAAVKYTTSDARTCAVLIVFLPIRRMSQKFLSAICSTLFQLQVTGITCEPLIALCQAIFEVMSSNLSEERANAKQGSVQ